MMGQIGNQFMVVMIHMRSSKELGGFNHFVEGGNACYHRYGLAADTEVVFHLDEHTLFSRQVPETFGARASAMHAPSVRVEAHRVSLAGRFS